MIKRRALLTGGAVLAAYQALPASARLMVNQLSGFGGVSGYVAHSVKFDGTSDYMTRGVDHDGAANAKKFLISFWINLNSAGDSSLQRLVFAAGATFDVTRNASNKITLDAYTDTGLGTSVFSLASSSSVTSSSGWTHVLIAGDAATSTEQMYIDDASDLASQSSSNNNFDVTSTDHSIGATQTGGNKFNGDISDVYVNYGETLDISSASNRSKFISGNKPVNLGETGTSPTGTKPIVLFNAITTAAWNTNVGSGGGYSVTGGLADGTTGPSD